MSVKVSYQLSDRTLDANSSSQQRQLSVSLSAAEDPTAGAPLNLCLILDHSGSMGGEPLSTVRQAACEVVDRLTPGDRLSIVAFDHRAKVVVANQPVTNPDDIKRKILALRAEGGTCIDDGIKLGLQELNKGKDGAISQAMILTDGENEHGDNQRCLKMAELAAEVNITLHTLGFGDSWNQDVLERIADAGRGSMLYIPTPQDASIAFQNLLYRVQTVGLTNASLILELCANVRLAELKPVAQVSPEVVELEPTVAGTVVTVRLGDLSVAQPKVLLTNLYLNPRQGEPGSQPNHLKILGLRVRYDHPGRGRQGQETPVQFVEAELVTQHQPTLAAEVQPHLLTLAKYRQTQLAEQKLQAGDPIGAATMLQSAAKTALQLGDQNAATVLQANATRLQTGTALSDAERKQTRMVSKTVLQFPDSQP